MIHTLSDFNSVSNSIECLIIGYDCLNKVDGKRNKELKMIDFSRFVNVRIIDIGSDSLDNIQSITIESVMIGD